LLLARTDRDCSKCEEEIIVAHCLDYARQKGVACSEAQTLAFCEYVASFRPAVMQLDPALARLAKCEHCEFAALVATAHAMVVADGVSRPEEIQFLARLQNDLMKLRAVP
ncbi:MAG TPA: hypothetical protein VGM36_02335, partial [Rhizomicrobium sp.]